MEDKISKLATAIEELKQWKETDFSLSPAAKQDEIKARTVPINTELDQLLQLELNTATRAAALQHKGVLLSFTEFKAAENCLTKAIKLEPRLWTGWLALGEVFWATRDFDSAKNCFEQVIQHRSDVPQSLVTRALRQLSMVLRQLGATETARRNNSTEAVKHATEAVSLDVRDGVSWYVLGNAHLTHFFAHTGLRANTTELRQALAAYKQAEARVQGETKVDLLYNRAEVYRYLAEYGQSIEGYTQVKALDPYWDMPKLRIQSVLDTCHKIQSFISQKGNFKPKRLKELSSKLTAGNCALKDLQHGDNPNKQLQVVVCGFVPSETNIPYHVLVVDLDSEFTALALYNVDPLAIKFEDVLLLTAPHMSTIEVPNIDTTVAPIHFSSLVLKSPLDLLINGKHISAREFSAAEVLINPVHSAKK
jgi:tetratricopeptide (TPR) repeat protein